MELDHDVSAEFVAFHHADPTVRQQWQGLSPAEFAELADEPEMEAKADRFRDLADFQEFWLAYLFSDGRPLEWRNVAVRFGAFCRAGGELEILRRDWSELDGFEIEDMPLFPFPLVDLMRQHEPLAGLVSKLLRHYCPAGCARKWLKLAVGNLYLLARLYQPDLVREDGKSDLPYERLSGILGEIPLEPLGYNFGEWTPPGMSLSEWKTVRDRARSRWSARAQQLIARPIERTSGRSAPAMFGKGAGVKAKYSLAAMGNQNRLRDKPGIDTR